MSDWQKAAWAAWYDKSLKNVPLEFHRAIQALEPLDRSRWLRRFLRPASPVALEMIKWLNMPAVCAVPGSCWDKAETSFGILIAYPEALDWDPLAMAAIAVLWAGHHPDRTERIVEHLGAALVPSLLAGELPTSEHAGLMASYRDAYRDRAEWVDKMFDVRPVGNAPFSLTWPALPDFEHYCDQLAYGVVPHEGAGQSPMDVVAVLLALHASPDQNRTQAAGLAFKAIEGRRLFLQWNQMHGRGDD